MGSISNSDKVPLANAPAPGIPYFTPAQNPPAGTPLDPSAAPTLFQPYRMRGVTLHNRVVVSPMCTYSAQDGHLTDFHLVHLGQYALAGAGLVMVEASAVEARGRISPEDSGLWADSQVAPLRKIVDFIHGQGGKAAIQLAHAGRKASTIAPWIGGSVSKVVADETLNGWPDDVVSASGIPYDEGWAVPKALSVEQIHGIVQAFVDSAKRAVEVGMDVIEIHGAHGYLITQFLSPISNKRTDDYGGSFENRTRLLREVVTAVRGVIPEDMPLWLRISATEWMEHTGQPSWDLAQSIELSKLLPGLGVDVLDVSSAGNHPDQRIEMHNRYQTDLAGQIRKAVTDAGLKLGIAAVGRITTAEVARSIVQADGRSRSGETIEVEGEGGQVAKADLVLAARQFLRDPQFVLKMAHELNVDVKWPNQYDRAKPKLKTRL